MVTASVPVSAKTMEIITDPELAQKAVAQAQESNDHTNPFGHHQRHNLPPPPSGTNWVYQTSSRRWSLEPLVEAEVTVLDCQGEADKGGSFDQQLPQQEPVRAILEHWVRPSDTFSGICLKYGVSATQLRRANYGFSGTNLSLAPNPLRVPNVRLAIPEERGDDRVRQIKALRFALQPRHLSLLEAKCYLELNDWNILVALENARQDLNDKEYSVDPCGERARFDTPVERVTIDGELVPSTISFADQE